MTKNEFLNHIFRKSNFLLRAKSAVTFIFIGWSITLFVFLYFLYSPSHSISGQNVVSQTENRSHLTNPVLEVNQTHAVKPSEDQKKLDALSVEVQRIQNLLDDKFKSFEELLISKLDASHDDDDQNENRPYPIEHVDLRKHWIRPKTTKAPRPDHLPKSDCPKLNEPVDAVYTWVNGSDPDFQSSLKGTQFEMKAPSKEDMHNQRFQDFNQLKYSIRSIEMYAPWIRNIYIITNGQKPSWAKMEHPNIFVVYHKDIFQEETDLPTFNSMAIEVHLHQIAGLSRRFIYFNDDFSFQAPVCMSDFWTEEKGYKVYQNGPVPKKVLDKKCSEECVSVKLGDGTCDKECNTLACLWDGDDCDGIAPEGSQDKRSTFYQSVDFVNVLFERTLTEKSERNWLPHVPFMFDIEIVKDMQEYYALFFSVTSRHKNRQKNDMQPEFGYAHWLKEATKSENVKVDPKKYKHQIVKGGPLAYISYKNDMKKNKPALERQVKSTKTKFLCINDLMDHTKPESETAKKELQTFYETIYPHKSEYEV